MIYDKATLALAHLKTSLRPFNLLSIRHVTIKFIGTLISLSRGIDNVTYLLAHLHRT